MTTSEKRNSNNKTARMVGVLFLVSTATYILGTSFIDSMLNAPDYLLHVYPNKIQLITGVLLQFVNSAAVVGIGVLLFPILKRQSEAVALGYAVTRLFECAFLVVGGIAKLSLISLSLALIQAGTPATSYFLSLGTLLVAGSQTAYHVAMIALGLGSLPFCYVLYQTRLIPRSLSVLGLIGYAALLIGSVLEILGLDLRLIHNLPGGLFELFLPLWLIVKGFKPSEISSTSAKRDMKEKDAMRVSKAL